MAHLARDRTPTSRRSFLRLVGGCASRSANPSLVEVNTMLCHPAELGVREILTMNRSALIAALLNFNGHFAFRFNQEDLSGMSNSMLRRTLMDVRRHYQARGY